MNTEDLRNETPDRLQWFAVRLIEWASPVLRCSPQDVTSYARDTCHHLATDYSGHDAATVARALDDFLIAVGNRVHDDIPF